MPRRWCRNPIGLLLLLPADGGGARVEMAGSSVIPRVSVAIWQIPRTVNLSAEQARPLKGRLNRWENLNPEAPGWTKRLRVGNAPPDRKPSAGRVSALEITMFSSINTNLYVNSWL